MAKQGKTARKYGRNKAKCQKYRERNNRKRHRGAEYRVRYGIGSGRISNK